MLWATIEFPYLSFYIFLMSIIIITTVSTCIMYKVCTYVHTPYKYRVIS